MRKKLLLAIAPLGLVALTLVLLFRPGFEEAGCACLPPPTLEEVARMTERANSGDTPDAIRATGEVYWAYIERGEKAQAEKWKQRAIAVGDPDSLGDIASDLLMKVNQEPDFRRKDALLAEALSLLERAYPNRGLIRDHIVRELFAENLRAARAAREVLRDGLDVWLARAKSGDATAAHHVAVHYFYVDLDQDKRSHWEDQAARLGDPGFASEYACCSRETKQDLLDGKRVIAIARANRKAWGEAGDIWLQSVLLEQLDRTESQIDQRLAKIG